MLHRMSAKLGSLADANNAKRSKQCKGWN